MSFWGVTLVACEAYTLTPESPLHVTKAVLGADADSNNGARNMVQCRVGDAQPVCICSLRAGSEEQTSMDLVFEQGTEVTFLTSGPGTVYLTGYFVNHFIEKEEEEEMDEDDDEDDEDYEPEDDDDDDDAGENDDDDDDENEKEKEEDDDDDEEEMTDEKAKKRNHGDSEEEEKPQKRACSLSPEKTDNKEAGKGRSVHFEEKKSPATKEAHVPVTPPPSHVHAAANHMQTPYRLSGRHSGIPDSNAPTESAQTSTSPSKQAKQSPGKQSPAKQQQQQQEKQKEQQQQKKKGPETRKTPEGLTITETRVGTGAVARPGNTVFVRYVGQLSNGKVFDKSGNKPFRFDLGTGQVIRGWDLGVKDMRVGGKRRLVIPPQLGYGRSGTGPIPPNATLIFDVELVSVR